MSPVAVQTRLLIRPLAVEEVSFCLPSGHAFYGEVDLPGTFSPDTFIRSWEAFYALDMGVILGLFNGEEYIGGLGGILAPNPNTGDLTALELFWYVMPEHRGSRKGIQLVKSYREWAKARGAKHWIMTHVHGRPENQLDRLYARLGLRRLETNWIGDC